MQVWCADDDLLWQVRDGNMFHAFEGFCPGRDVMDGVKDLGAVIPHSTSVTYANGNSFEYDEALLMLESFAVDFLRANCTFAVFAHVTVDSFLSGIC